MKKRKWSPRAKKRFTTISIPVEEKKRLLKLPIAENKPLYVVFKELIDLYEEIILGKGSQPLTGEGGGKNE